MNKDEILAKSRESNKDEGIEHAMNKGRSIGISVMSIMVIALGIYNLALGLNNDAILTLYFIYIGVQRYSVYQFTKKKLELVITITAIIAGICSLTAYIIGTLR